MRNPLTRLGIVGAAAILAATAAAPGATFAQDDATAQLRVAHGVSDAPAVDVYADGALLAGGIPFGTVTAYLSVPAGTYTVEVVPAGAELEAGPVVIGPVDLTFDDGSATTVAATGLLANGIVPQVISDDFAPEAGVAQVRGIHLIADAPGVDVAPDGADALVEDLMYPADTGYLALDPGAYDLEIRVADTADVAVQIPEVTLEDGTSSSIFVIGNLSDGSQTFVATLDATIPAVANVRVGHFSQDAPNVDVFVDGAAVLEDVPFTAVSPYLQLPPGTYRIQVAPAGDGPDASVIDAELSFDGDTWTTVAATGNIADGSFGPTIYEDLEPVAEAGTAKVRAYHASADAPRRVDIAPDGAAKRKAVIKKLTFGESAGFLEIAAGDLDLDVRQPNKKKKIFDIEPLPLADGNVYSVFAIGSPANDTFQVIAVVDASVA